MQATLVLELIKLSPLVRVTVEVAVLVKTRFELNVAAPFTISVLDAERGPWTFKFELMVEEAVEMKPAKVDSPEAESVPVMVVLPAASVPVVERFSSPKEMFAEVSVMEPPAKMSVLTSALPDTVSEVEEA